MAYYSFGAAIFHYSNRVELKLMQPVAKSFMCAKVSLVKRGETVQQMLSFGLNHMTVPRSSARNLLDLAAALGCVGIELRNDLGGAIFDGISPAEFGAAAQDAGLRILALAEVKLFNIDPPGKAHVARDLIQTAAACGAEGVALIPWVGETVIDRPAQRDALRVALKVMQPVLEDHGMVGLIEPLGFINSSLRFKEDVVAVLDDLDRPACFRIVHDTFHHHLAGSSAVYPELTGLVHISGISDPVPSTNEMTDAHRVLVDTHDRLGNVAQLRALRAGGYAGPASLEVFAPEIHDIHDPATALAGSLAFITSQLTDHSAVRA